MAFWAYMLRYADGRYYTGHTDDLEQRMAQHQAGGFCGFTSRRQPVVLVWSEAFPTRLEALEAECRIKGWTGAKKEALIAGDWIRLHQLAVSREARPSTSLRTSGVVEESQFKIVVDERLPVTPLVPSEVEAREPNAVRKGR